MCKNNLTYKNSLTYKNNLNYKNNLTYKDNLNYDNSPNYKETVIARSIENTTKHEAEPKCACTISVACRSAKCQLSEAKAKQSRKATNITRLLRYARNDNTCCKSTILNSNNNLTPNPRPLPLMFASLNSHFAERQVTDCKQAHFGSALCFLLVSLASALRQTFASLTGDVMQAYIPLPLCFKGEGECTLIKNSNISINPPVSKADIPPYKGGRGGRKFCQRLIFKSKKITPHPNLLPQGFTSLTSFNLSKSAFSLIELSIVLIIIGLLIAGVTGGASLIQSAKVRQMMNELKDYERAVYTFQAAKGRYPGDVKNYGTFGMYSNYDCPTCTSSSYARPGYAYQASDFPSEFITEFQKTAGSGVLPDYNSAPFVELYNEGIIDFRPLGNIITVDKSNSSTNGKKKATPSLKAEPKAYIYFIYTGKYSGYTGKPCTKGVENCAYYNGLAYSGQIKEVLISYYLNSSQTKGFDPKFLKAVDEKIDDGWYSTGIFRGGCYGSSSYENAIENGKKCGEFRYAI